MKNILLVRHAKSSWDSPLVKDFDRPLNERGLKDAPAMAQRLLEKGVTIDAFITSPAVRAITTCTIFANAFNKQSHITAYKDLYNAPARMFLKAIKKAEDEWNTIAIFAHNPGITDFANTLTDTNIDEMPTCSIFAVHADISHWKDFEKAQKKFWFFDYPKND